MKITYKKLIQAGGTGEMAQSLGLTPPWKEVSGEIDEDALSDVAHSIYSIIVGTAASWHVARIVRIAETMADYSAVPVERNAELADLIQGLYFLVRSDDVENWKWLGNNAAKYLLTL